MKYTKYILSLMFLASLNGCIKEDMSDCPGNCLLEFSYVGDGTTQIFQDKIHKVDMYVFDSDGVLLSSHPISEADIKTRATELKLPIGNYRIVTVGNTYHTEVSNGQSLATAQFCDKNCISGERIVGNDSLYYAYKEISIPGDAQQIKEQMDFASSHYKVHVEVVGTGPVESATRTPVWPLLSMSGLSSMTGFDNKACGNIVTYYPETENNAEKHTMLARFNIMRHTNHENVNLDLTDANGAVSYTHLYVSRSLMGEEERKEKLLLHLDKYGCITRADYESITGLVKHRAVSDLNRYLAEGMIRKYGSGKTVVYLKP